MDVFDAIKKRRCVRKYLSVPVEWENVGKVLDAGRMAPSAGNLQDWKFIIVLDPDKRKEVAEACMQQYWMNAAPVHIVVCGEPAKVKRFYAERGEKLYSIQNCALAAENIFLAATALDLGMAWVGAFDDTMLRRALSIPDTAVPYAVLTLGYPDETPGEPAKYTIENVVFFEKWGNRIKDAAEMYREYSDYVKRALLSAKKLVERITKK